jgi:protein-disulfide isomerase
LSRYGSFMGVPVALAGVFFFALVLSLAVAARGKTHAAESAPGYIFALSTIGLAFVLYLGWASYVVLKAFCMLCAITYVSVIGLFIVSGGATSFPMTTLPRRALRDARTLIATPVALVTLLLLLVGAGSLAAFFPHEGAQAEAAMQAPSYPPLTDEERANIEKWWNVQKKEELPIPAESAKVVIVKFSDYMCPACRQTWSAYRGIFAKYEATGDLKFILKHYPLEAECNQYANGNHFASCEAAAAVVMARSKGTADKLEEWIYGKQEAFWANNQPGAGRDLVKQGARDIGGITDFDAQYDHAIQEVKMDAGLGGLLKIKSTPTFFINGRRIEGGVAPQAIEGIIQLEIKRASTK